MSIIKLNNDITLETILNTDDEYRIGYIVECDLTFPKHLHDKFKMFPPSPENITPKKEWLSQFQTDLIEEYQHNTKCKKWFLIYTNIKIIVFIIEI